MPGKDSLEINIREDLSRVDKVMTRLLFDETSWKKFLHDPNGVLIDLGLHPPTRSDINQRCNAIMFATLSNKPLLELTKESAEGFFRSIQGSPEAAEWSKVYREGLDQARIQNDIDYDMAYIEYILKDEALLRKRLRLAFDNLNRRKLLSKTYDDETLYRYIDATIDAAKQYKDRVEFPVLEEWDDHYGVGRLFGVAIYPEVAFDFTAFVGVEVAFAITALGFTDHACRENMNALQSSGRCSNWQAICSSLHNRIGKKSYGQKSQVHSPEGIVLHYHLSMHSSM